MVSVISTFQASNCPPGPLSNAMDLIPRIVMAMDTRYAPERDDGTAKSLSDYLDVRQSQNRGRLRQALINFYEEAKAGDLVVMPGPFDQRMVHVGEFTSDSIIYVDYYKSSATQQVPARSIKWLNKIRENKVSSSLSEALRNQHPFTLIERSRFVEVMSIAYSSFIYGDRHVSTILNGDEFLDTDAAFISQVSKLAGAACLAADNQLEGLGDELLSVFLRPLPTHYTCSQESDIHSEGFTRLIGSTMTPIVTSALISVFITLSSLNTPEAIAQEIGNIQFVNSAGNIDHQCLPRVSELASRVLSTLNIDETMKMCEAAREAAERAKIRPSAKVAR